MTTVPHFSGLQAAEEQLPARFGRYVLLQRVGTGGMGVVYRATMEGLAGFEKTVALKCILPHLVQDSPEFVRDLISEAKLVVLMNHPNVIQVYDLGQVGPQVYLSMEFVRGESVGRIIARLVAAGPNMPIPAAVTIGVQAAAGLDYAHNLRDNDGTPLNLVHRDISPQNLLVDASGVVKIIDFGIAKAASNLSLTDPGTVKGKLGYLAPEQLAGQGADRRCDIFALGVVLYECLCGRRLFAQSPSHRPVGDMLTTTVPDLRLFREDVTPELATVIHTALKREPAERYQTAAEFGAALQAACRPLDSLAFSKALGLDQIVQQQAAAAQRAAATAVHEESTAPVEISGLTPSGFSKGHSLIGTTEPQRAHRRTPPPLRTAKRGTKGIAMGVAGTLAAVGVVAGLYLATVDQSAPPASTGSATTQPVTPQVGATGPLNPTPSQPDTAAQADPAKTQPAPDPGSGDTGVAPASSKDPEPKKAGPPRQAKLTPLSATEIEREVRRRASLFNNCIKKHFDPKLHPEGVLYLRFKILKTGSVAEIGVTPEDYTKGGLGGCLREAGKSVKLRSHTDEFIEIQFPFEVRVRANAPDPG